MGDLVISNDTLFGMTTEGGKHNWGLIFAIDTSGLGYADLFNFNGTDGIGPIGDVSYVSGKLYGMTSDGGNSSQGIVFGYAPCTPFTITRYSWPDTGSGSGSI